MVLGWGVNEEGWRKGPWTPEEDKLLIQYVGVHGEGRWSSVSRFAGLKRNAKSCRLRWVNYLRPELKKGQITPHEENIILEQHAKWGNRWSTIARSLPGRTDNEIKNYWRTHFKKESAPSAYFKKTKMQPPRFHQYPQEEQQILPREDQHLRKMIMFLVNQGDIGVLLNQKKNEEIPEQQYLTSCLSQSNSSLPEMVNQSIMWADLWNSNEVYSNMHVPEEAEVSPDIYSQANFTYSS